MRKILVLLIGFMAFAIQSMAQDKVVTGKVTDDNGAPLSGVTIKIKGGKSLGATKTDGTYSIKAPANTILQFSSVGSTTSEMQVPANGILDMSLKSATGENLNEVVVIGYGTAKKKDLTGSVVAISSKDFVKGALTTPEQLIAGKVAGVSITPNGGAPGSGSVIRIRGGASLNASNDPLIVIDGVPIDNGGIAGSPNALGMINPNDIETFTILKDASAAAIYGSRASNGVIIVTTKKGKSGKARYNFSSMTSLYTPARKIDVLTADQHRAFVTGLNNPAYTSLLGTANTDWQDQIYQSALGSDNNFSVSGTTKGKMPYRVSVGFLDQNGILKTGNLRRVTAAINLSPKFLKNNLSVDLNLRGTVSQSRFANEGAIGAAVNFDPTKPIRANSGRFGGYWEWLDPASTTGLKSLAPLNPVGLLNQLDNRSHVERSIGNIQFDYKVPFIPGLRANVNLGYDVSKGSGTTIINDSAAMSYRRFKDANNVMHGGTNTRYRSDKANILLESYLSYNKETGIGNIDFRVGYSYQSFTQKNYFYADRTFNGTVVNAPNFNFDEPTNRLIGIFGRLEYKYKNFAVNASMRRDGSSRFSPDSRWGDFWAVNGSWRIKEEGFLKNVDFINDLKIRGGYGVTGQQDGIGNFDWQPFYGLSSNQSQYQFGNTFLNLFSPFAYYPNRRWEETGMTSIALDFAIAKNRISGTIEYYNRDTRYLLQAASQPAGSNFSNIIVANIGNMKNEGLEFTLNTQLVKKKDFTFDLGFNATYNKNTITNLTLNPDPNFKGALVGGISGGTGNTIQINSVGYARSAFYTFKQIYDKSGKPIDGLFEDRNRDGIINSDDLSQYKQPDPIVVLGISGNIGFKKWSAGFVMRGNFDNYVYNNNFSNTGVVRNIVNPIGYLNNGNAEVLNSGMSGNGANYFLSDYWIQNASFLRMDNINIGFNAGDVFKNNTSLRLGVNVQNAFIITKYRGLDPEVFGGIDNTLYTRPRVFVLSVNLDF
jgi:TonB-linked SusC/RagA family outer membrane protein